MKLYEWDKVPVEPLNALCTRQVLHTAQMTIARIHLRPGAVVPEHRHVNEQVTTIQKGRLRFTIEGRETILQTGQSLVLDSNLPHAVEALEDTVALDVFAPPREDWQRGDDAYLRGGSR